jgi:H+-transporting ATPase
LQWLIFLELLWAPMPIMIWIAAATEAGIQNWLDMGILLFIQFANASIGFYETVKAGDAVEALKKSLQPKATVNRDGRWAVIDAALVVPGDLVLLGAGSAIPADCTVNQGTIDVDQAALTGESLPVTMRAGSECLMGSTVSRGETEATVKDTGSRTFFGKTAQMIQNTADELGNLQKLLMRIVLILVVLSILLSGIVFVFLEVSGNPLESSISFTVVLIVASIPIAIEIVCTTTLALGSRELSKRGAIVTRLASIEDMAGMNMLCSDKTGTLTLNRMVIQDDIYTPNKFSGRALTQPELLRYAAMAAKWKEPPRDALDKMVLEAVDLSSLDDAKQFDYMPFDPVIKRTEGTVAVDENTYKVTKGAPHVILKLLGAADGNIIEEAHAEVDRLGDRGIRCIAVARAKIESTDMNGRPTPGASDESALQWELLGMLSFLDPPRPDTKDTIARARAYGVEVKMITGDNLKIAVETAKTLSMGTGPDGRDVLIRGAEGLPMLDPETKKAPPDLPEKYGAYIREGDGFASVFPEHKFLIVQTLREMKFKVGMTGDGVNDAPALKRADVGVAVSGATDAARAASDIVLTDEGLSTIVEALIISRCIFQRMKNFITYRIAATLQLLVFFFIAVPALKPTDFQPDDDDYDGEDWPDYFTMPVLMLMLITLLNDGTLIAIGYDNVTPSQYPNTWNLPVLFTISSVLAAVALISSIALLYMMLDSWNDNSVLHKLGFSGFDYEHIITAIYLKVSISDFLTLFSARTHDGFFWSSMPSPILLAAAAISLTISTILACFWPDSKPDDVPTEGLVLGGQENPEIVVYIWLYCIVFWFIQDAAKVLTYYILEKYNIFGINDSLRIGEGSSAQIQAVELEGDEGASDQRSLLRKSEKWLKGWGVLGGSSASKPAVGLGNVAQKDSSGLRTSLLHDRL